jgi:hypothetical protein
MDYKKLRGTPSAFYCGIILFGNDSGYAFAFAF